MAEIRFYSVQIGRQTDSSGFDAFISSVERKVSNF